MGFSTGCKPPLVPVVTTSIVSPVLMGEPFSTGLWLSQFLQPVHAVFTRETKWARGQKKKIKPQEPLRVVRTCNL